MVCLKSTLVFHVTFCFSFESSLQWVGNAYYMSVSHEYIARLILELLIYRISIPYPFQWGAPTFDAGEAFAMMAASFVALVEVLSNIYESL